MKKNNLSKIEVPNFSILEVVVENKNSISENSNFSLQAGFEDEEDCMNDDYENEEVEQKSIQEPKEEKKEKSESSSQPESKSSEHDGKYFVVQKGMCQCNKGTKFPNLKVSSHQKHYWNDEKGQPDNRAVTEDDLQFNPPAVPFGNCSVKNGNSCTYAPAGKWTKTYEKVKVMGKNCVTELSELMCTTGGKITILKHGQQSEAGKSNVQKADFRVQHVYNPIMDYNEFREELYGNDVDAW